MFASRLRGVRLILCALSHLIPTPTVSRHRVRQTSVVFCEARAFLIRSSLICRNSQLASSAVIQGLCVVFCGLGYAWSKRVYLGKNDTYAHATLKGARDT